MKTRTILYKLKKVQWSDKAVFALYDGQELEIGEGEAYAMVRKFNLGEKIPKTLVDKTILGDGILF